MHKQYSRQKELTIIQACERLVESLLRSYDTYRKGRNSIFKNAVHIQKPQYDCFKMCYSIIVWVSWMGQVINVEILSKINKEIEKMETIKARNIYYPAP